jgi:hypothetical protein
MNFGVFWGYSEGKTTIFALMGGFLREKRKNSSFFGENSKKILQFTHLFAIMPL